MYRLRVAYQRIQQKNEDQKQEETTKKKICQTHMTLSFHCDEMLQKTK